MTEDEEIRPMVKPPQHARQPDAVDTVRDLLAFTIAVALLLGVGMIVSLVTR